MLPALPGVSGTVVPALSLVGSSSGARGVGVTGSPPRAASLCAWAPGGSVSSPEAVTPMGAAGNARRRPRASPERDWALAMRRVRAHDQRGDDWSRGGQPPRIPPRRCWCRSASLGRPGFTETAQKPWDGRCKQAQKTLARSDGCLGRPWARRDGDGGTRGWGSMCGG